MLGHRQPLASPDGEVFSPRCRKDVLCGWHTVLYARFFVLHKTAHIYNYPNFFLSFFQKKLFRNGVYRWHLIMGRKGEKRLSGYSEDYISKCFWVFH